MSILLNGLLQVVSEPDIVEAATELDAVFNAANSREPDAAARLAE